MRRPILSALVLTAIWASAPPPAATQAAPRPFLFKDARGELAHARARGEADVLLVVASMPGENARMAQLVEERGGTVQFRADEVDYLRARVPVEHAEALAAHPAVLSAEVSITRRSRTFGRTDHDDAAPAPEPSAPRRTSGTPPAQAADTIWPPVLSDHPIRNRYSPLADIGAADLRESHPTWDGRGVLIAMIDLSPDPLLPELQVARTIDGAPVPKIAAYLSVTDADEEDDGRWLRMEDEVTASREAFTWRDSAYVAPRPGKYRIDVVDEEQFDSLSRADIDEDLNRDGNPEGSSRLFAVLWDPTTGDVWLDADQDRDFSDEQPLTDFSARPEFGVLGTDDPETPVRESVGFAVQIDSEKGRVALNWGVASHASLVVGAAVASRGERGRFDGVAPGARLAAVAEGGSAYGQTEAAIVAARIGSDVLYFEQSSLITRNYLLRDGRLVPTVVYERLIEEYGVSILSPTHNYPIVGGSDDFVVGRGVIGIGGHESRDNFFANHGVRVEHEDNLLITGGYGPMGNGALEPDVISPSNYVSTARGFDEGEVIPGLFELPPGYTIAGGTSTATPTAAGAVAVLLSAAKQEGLKHDAYRIQYAVTRGARWVPHLPAYKQGNGVVNVAGAWEVLKALDRAPDDIVGLTIEVRAPVRHEYSHLLATPHEGVGLFERHGWAPGDRAERAVTFTRTSGPEGFMAFALTWAGNEHGTFSAPAMVNLPLGAPVRVPITIAPGAAGAHTAHLTLEHPDVPGWAHRMLVAVVAAEALTAENGYRIEKKEVEVPRPGMTSFFYAVPEGAKALRVEVSAKERAVGLSVVRPDTRETARHRGAANDTGKTVRVIRDPPPGVWEVRLDDVADTRTFDWKQAKGEGPVPPTEVTLTVSALATDAAVAAPQGGGEAVRLTNKMAAFEGGATSLPMGSARRERRMLAQKEQHVWEVDVPAGSTLLVVRVSGVSSASADLDLYLFDCTGDECEPAAADGDPAGTETVVVENPAAGVWKVVVDGFSVPSGSIGYDLLDVVFNPAYGAVGTLDPPEERETGAVWTATANVWGPGTLEGGRTPFAAVLVRGQPEEGESFWIDLVELRPEAAAAAGR